MGAMETVKAPLDDVMLSMDVVDTLRQEERIAERELDGEARRAQLIERLRQIYHGQGIEVPDRIIEEGVKALEEQRFAYQPPRASFKVALAKLYVTRMEWGRWVGGGLAALALVWIGWQAFYVWPRAEEARRSQIELTETLPKRLATLYSSIETDSQVPAVLQQAAQIRDGGLAAAKAGQTAAARKAEADLTALLGELRLAYDIRIVSRPGEMSGLWRIPKVNKSGRNYYLVVEAIDASGNAIERPVTNEENGKREMVKKWAVRVPKSVFDRVQADKKDDGIIENNIVGVKRRGEAEPQWRVEVSGGALTKW
jgi:Family of unknown function (DUF6384)